MDIWGRAADTVRMDSSNDAAECDSDRDIFKDFLYNICRHGL